MVTFLLKKKKPIQFKNKKSSREEVKFVRRASLISRLNRKHKPITKSVNLQKKKTQIITSKGGKRFKKFLTPILSNQIVRCLGDARPNIGLIGLQCKRSCKLNYTTMMGIKKKSFILKKNIHVWFRKYPSLQLTRKSTGHRMGKGKGKFSARVAIYKKGEIILEISYIDMGVFNNYFDAIIKTLPVPVKKVYKSNGFFRLMETGFAGISNFKREFKKRRRW